MNLLDDRKLWGNEAAEDEEPAVLSSYFVRQPEFDTFFDPGVRLSIARARKGMGKSALLKECEYLVGKDGKAVVVSLKGADLVAQRPVSELSADEHIHDWQQRICMCINHHLGAELGFAFNDDHMLLVEGAELVGYRRRNLIGSLVARLQGRLGPVELKQLETRDHHRLLKRITNEGDWQVWVLVDDIDATFANTPEQCLRIATFFSACRDLASGFRGINLRACVRTDVWASMRTVDESLDKCEQYIFDLHWSIRSLGQLLVERVTSYADRRAPELAAEIARDLNEKGGEFPELGVVFAPKFPWGRSRVPPHRVIHALASGRPRWALQLCRMAAAQASRAGETVIKFGHIKQALEQYGRLRLDDLVREHQHQCPAIGQVLNAFSRAPTLRATDAYLAFLRERVLARLAVEIDGHPVADALELLHFLFRIGFVQGVAQVGRSKRYFRYEDRPELLRSPVNLDDGMDWQIQQAFQAALGLPAG